MNENSAAVGASHESSGVLDARAETQVPDIGLSSEDVGDLAELLSIALADTYALYLKTQGFHWNVVGPLFYSLHKQTEEQYTDLGAAVDELAERIRAIGHPAPASFSQFSRLTQIVEESGVPNAEEMIRQLVEGNEACSRSLRAAVKAASRSDDVKTADLLTDRIGQHEQNIWMLGATLAR